VPDVQKELQAVLDSIKENYFHSAFEAWESYGISIYIPSETVLKEMAAKIKSRNFPIEHR
jgi:hypothetical protein